MKKQNGVTLVELMVVVMVIGILSAIAYPSYQKYARRTNRVMAKTVMMEVQSREESYFSDRKRYADDLTKLSYPAATTFYITNTGDTSASTSGTAIYSITLSATTATGASGPTSYSIAAAPLNTQTRDTDCGTLTLKSTGKKIASGNAGADCWR